MPRKKPKLPDDKLRQMAEEFENELSKLDDSVVIMCSVELKN